ncbi:nucleoside-diphosphate sugar epimerase [Nonomuraea typhae]|uniref:Nucleoside-diphosphate sugar epimerase n=1 Tax=Nonomuraea typhae TaxID=2603600 RepID=A0ABW7Z2A9_9ACTN
MCEIFVTPGLVGDHVHARLSRAGIPVRRYDGDQDLSRMESVFLDHLPLTAERAAPMIDTIARHARRVVAVSSAFHAEVEKLIEHSGIPWTILRAGSLAADALAFAGQVRAGVVRWPYGGAGRAVIHEKDVAAVATHVLASAGHGGRRYVLSGPETLTLAEQVRVIGEVAGRAVRWEDLAPGPARAELLKAWADETVVDAKLEEWGAFAGSPEVVTDTVRVLTGRAPRTFRQWAQDHADAFR